MHGVCYTLLHYAFAQYQVMIVVTEFSSGTKTQVGLR